MAYYQRQLQHDVHSPLMSLCKALEYTTSVPRYSVKCFDLYTR